MKGAILPIFWSTITLSLLGLVVWWIVYLNSRLDPINPPHGTINITRQEYNEAAAKWRSWGITEYEMTVGIVTPFENSNPWTLRVRSHDVAIVGYSRATIDGPVPATPDPSVTGDDLKDSTVDAIFALVDEILKNGPFEQEMGVDGLNLEGLKFWIDYTVEFDPELGYPTSITTAGRSPQEWTQDGRFFRSSAPGHYYARTYVSRLKVLQQSAPTSP